MKRLVKIKSVKGVCIVCKLAGSIQLFLNRDGEVKYARTRHYSHSAKNSKKPQFTYCKIEELEPLKTLITQQGVSLSVVRADGGQISQGQTEKIQDLELKDSSPNQQNKQSLGSLARWGVTLVR